MLKGYKTKAVAWVMALAPVFALIGYEIDPDQVSAWIEQFDTWIAGGYVMLGAAAHWARNQAGK